VTNWPGNTMPLVTAGQGMLRTSRADREHVIGVLQVAFVQGRLAQDEFEARIGHTLMSRTYAELSAVTADLPPLLVGSQLPRMTAVGPGRKPKKSAAAKVVAGGFIGLVVSVVALVVAVLTGNPVELLGAALAVVLASVIAGTAMMESWDGQQDRARLRLTA
jgi:uncharacterized protein DUF1707